MGISDRHHWDSVSYLCEDNSKEIVKKPAQVTLQWKEEWQQLIQWIRAAESQTCQNYGPKAHKASDTTNILSW